VHALLHDRFHIGFDLIGIGDAIETIEQIDDGDQFTQAVVLQTQPQHGG
jgi:hypothetical protein